MFGSWSFRRIAWSLRKALLIIGPADIVLDVGSGSSPHPGADVLLERYLDPKHRYGAMVIDRPTVLADACKMPFRDKAFDFVIAFHVLEHVADPTAFLKELQRVGKAGYIETPNAVFERLVPYDVHLLEVMKIKDKLIINKKSSAKPDSFLNGLELIKHSPRWNRCFYGNPELFHVRYFWKDEINFEVLNPDVSSSWFVDPRTLELDDDQELVTTTRLNGVRALGLAALRKWHKFRKRTGVDLADLLACPECHGLLSLHDELATCDHCQATYSLRPVPDFNRRISVTRPSDPLKQPVQC